ncbi:hypothetical protein DRP07_09765 [Archaeoglobales archaeon]|nr:MAG: hypothetical protein DRP07_09765 [Archaeoglobales archaeon]
MSCIFCMYFSSCGGMGEICEHFRLKEAKKSQNSIKRLREVKSMTISEAAKNLNMTVTDFLTYIGNLEKEGKLKIKFL